MLNPWKQSLIIADDFDKIAFRKEQTKTAAENRRIRNAVESGLKKELRRARRSRAPIYVDVTVSVDSTKPFATFPQGYKEELEKQNFKVTPDNDDSSIFHITKNN